MPPSVPAGRRAVTGQRLPRGDPNRTARLVTARRELPGRARHVEEVVDIDLKANVLVVLWAIGDDLPTILEGHTRTAKCEGPIVNIEFATIESDGNVTAAVDIAPEHDIV